jgi:hypothetical protein
LANLTAPRISPEKSVSKTWLQELGGGLPLGFDYRAVRSAADARAMMFELPGCDRAKAAVELYHHRKLVGSAAAYIGIMLAWTHDGHRLLHAFGSARQFIRALRTVVPPAQVPMAQPIQIWRGLLLSKTAAIEDSIGLSWTRSRDVACWFAWHDYVPALQPSLVPVVLRARLNRLAIVAEHNARAEQEVIVDLSPYRPADCIIQVDGTNLSGPDLRMSVADLCADGRIFDRLSADWHRAAARYEHWKNLLKAKTYPG